MKAEVNYCTNCEETAKFIRGKCEKCKEKYDDVVPASYRKKLAFDHGKPKPRNHERNY
jgi:hypothetical protein